jgi:hypothetical protein
MHVKSMLRAALLASVFAPVLAVSGVMAAGGFDNGTQNCSASRTVYVYSQSSVWVDHYWMAGHHTQYYTPYQQYRASSTTYSSTWWTVEYDYQRISNGAACEQ